MIPKSKASVFLNSTLDLTGLSRNEFVGVAAYLVRSKQAKTAGEAIKMLDSGTVDVEEIENFIIQSYQKELPKQTEPEPELDNIDSQ
jgi:hypothetical protein